MAMRICEVCGERFYAGVGKPPRTCPDHRGTKLPPRNRQDGGRNQGHKTEQVIDKPEAVEGLPEDGSQHVHTERTNKYDGRCFVCSLTVKEGQGYLYRVEADKPAKAFHPACLTTYKATEKDADKVQQGTDKQVPDISVIKNADPDTAIEAVKALLATLTPSIDEDGVRAIVADAIGDQLSEERIKNLVRLAGVMKHEIVIDGREIEMPAVSHYLLPTVVAIISAGEHCFMPGPAGSGKSTIAMQAAEILGLPFHSISFGPTTPTSKLFGFVDANGNVQTTEFRKAYECLCDDETYDWANCTCGGLFLGDEIDNGHPGLVAELNQALANPYCAMADRMVRKGRRFVMVVTGNTFGRGPDRLFVGRNILDAATLDRFTTLEIPIDEAMETRVASAYATGTYADLVNRWIAYVQKVRAKVMDNKYQFVVSPRATIGGAKMLQGGMDWDTVCDIRLFAGMNAETRRTVA